MFDPKKLGEEADAMISALNQMTSESSEQQPADGQQAIADPSAQDQGVEATPAPAPEPVQTPEPVAQPTQLSQELASLRREIETANQRWRVAQGMIEKKDTEIEQLRTLLAGLAAKQPEQAAPKAEHDPGIPSEKLVTAADIEEYSSSLHDFVVRTAKDVVHELLRGYDSRLNERFAKVESSATSAREASASVAASSFETRLAALVPDWETINTDAGFLEWLQVPDRLTGEPRLELLRRAYSAMDVNRVAIFFSDYKSEMGVTTPTPAPAPAPTEEATGQRVTPQELVSPGQSKASAAKSGDGASNQRIWTRADISRLYDDHMAKRISHAEFEKLERDMFKAQREGRIAA